MKTLSIRLLTAIASATALVGALGVSGAQAADDRLAKIESSGELRVCHHPKELFQ